MQLFWRENKGFPSMRMSLSSGRRQLPCAFFWVLVRNKGTALHINTYSELIPLRKEDGKKENQTQKRKKQHGLACEWALPRDLTRGAPRCSGNRLGQSIEHRWWYSRLSKLNASWRYYGRSLVEFPSTTPWDTAGCNTGANVYTSDFFSETLFETELNHKWLLYGISIFRVFNNNV